MEGKYKVSAFLNVVAESRGVKLSDLISKGLLTASEVARLNRWQPLETTAEKVLALAEFFDVSPYSLTRDIDYTKIPERKAGFKNG